MMDNGRNSPINSVMDEEKEKDRAYFKSLNLGQKSSHSISNEQKNMPTNASEVFDAMRKEPGLHEKIFKMFS